MYWSFIFFSGYNRGIRSLLVLALYALSAYAYSSRIYFFASFVCYIGIAYQLPGAFTGERANLLASHMKAMGLLDSARVAWAHLFLQMILQASLCSIDHGISAYRSRTFQLGLLWH